MIDAERATHFLDEFLAVAREANRIQNADFQNYYKSPAWMTCDENLTGRLPALRQIVAKVLPGAEAPSPDHGMYATVWREAERIVVEAVGALAHEVELHSILGPDGPVLAANALHHWVWESASSAWQAGLRRSAVQAAATRVDNETQFKLGRDDLTGKDLASQAWSSDPPKSGSPRLRPTGFGSPSSASFVSALEGARAFHIGAIQRIRNLATHSTDEPEEQVALEELAALSVLARWIDEAEVVR